MMHYNYSPEQLENKAEELLRQFDEERLRKPKPIDVYAVIEKCLGVEYDWKYLNTIKDLLNEYKPAGRTFSINLYDYE